MDNTRSPGPLGRSGLPAAPLAALDTEAVEARSLPVSPVSAGAARAAGWGLADLWPPAVVLRADALTHNLGRFAAWCVEHDLSYAPHGKTTMAPRLWAAQLAHGAWGITAATVAQARVMRRYGVPRVLIANEIADTAGLQWIAGQLADPDFAVYCLVDSEAGVDLADRALAKAHAKRPLPVLVELGVPGRRTGVRGVAEAVAIAERVAASAALRLVGVEGYEGVLPQRRDDASQATARTWLDDIATLAVTCDERGLFEGLPEIVLSAGGSGYFDLVADAFAELPALSRPVRRVLRSGCYISHDHLSYERSSPLRSGADPDPLVPALLAYALVLSCPEPGRALLGLGRRDVAFDIDLPAPLSARRDGVAIPLKGRARIVELNDHHGFCDHEPGLLRVGDLVELGLSHPCTVFDKWPLLPVLDADDRVVEAVRTLF